MAFGFGLKHESQHAHGRGEDETAADAPARIDGITVPTQGAEVSEDPGLGSGSGDSASSAVPEVPAGGAGVPTGDAAVPAGSAGVPADPGVPVVLAGGAGVPKDSESPISSGDPGVSAGGAGVPKEQYTEVIQPFVGDETARILYTAPPANKFDSIIAPSPQHLSELNATHISAWFGDHKVLEDVSLLMPAGQVTALIGPSGCGKSTFLRILNRMHELVPGASLAGEVRLDGKDIYDADERLTDARRDIGMVFQRPNPFPAMSIYDNVVAGLKLTGTKASRDEKDVLVESSLRRAGLWNEVKDRLAEPGGGLSGGQQQRLCIARSLAIKPKVLLMDEPCSALDPTSTRVIEETMTEMKREVTIVIVTHNMQQAERVSQQCAFFLATLGTPGQIVEYGDTDAMFHDPQDKRTRDYVSGRFG